MYKSDSVWKKAQKNEVSFVVQVYNKTSRPLFTSCWRRTEQWYPTILLHTTTIYLGIYYNTMNICMHGKDGGTLFGYYTYLYSSEVGGEGGFL